MGFDTPATAEGDLARTPFAHLLVYAADQRLTGALFLCEPPTVARPTVEHVVRFARGTPVKVYPGDGYALLGELLIEAGALSKETLEQALATKGLLGDVLILAGCVDRDQLEETCQAQFRKRMTRLFTLPEETTFRYYDGHPALLDYGGEPSCADALAILWAGLQTQGGAPNVVDATLSRLGDVPLRIHPQATVARLGLADDEARVVEHLRASAEGLPAIAERRLLPFERLCRLVYALTITRQLDLGASAPPVGALDTPRSTTFARLQLKATSHRLGAAAPDAPGDGERGAVSSKSSTSSRTPSSAPVAVLKPRVVEPPQMAVPRKATANDRETLKSAGTTRVSERPRPISVEVIDLNAPAEQTPRDAEAAKALEDLEGPPAKPRSGLLGWLFGR